MRRWGEQTFLPHVGEVNQPAVELQLDGNEGNLRPKLMRIQFAFGLRRVQTWRTRHHARKAGGKLIFKFAASSCGARGGHCARNRSRADLADVLNVNLPLSPTWPEEPVSRLPVSKCLIQEDGPLSRAFGADLKEA